MFIFKTLAKGEGLSISHEIKWVLTRLEVQFIFLTEKCSTHALVVFCLVVKHGLHMTDYVGVRVRERKNKPYSDRQLSLVKKS